MTTYVIPCVLGRISSKKWDPHQMWRLISELIKTTANYP